MSSSAAGGLRAQSSQASVLLNLASTPGVSSLVVVFSPRPKPGDQEAFAARPFAPTRRGGSRARKTSDAVDSRHDPRTGVAALACRGRQSS